MELHLITGYVGQDATQVKIKDKNYAKFSLAVSKGENTQWWDCLKSDPEGKGLGYFKKGTSLILQGEISVGAYMDKSGKAVGTLSMWVNHWEFGKGSKVVDSDHLKKDADADVTTPDDGDLPF